MTQLKTFILFIALLISLSGMAQDQIILSPATKAELKGKDGVDGKDGKDGKDGVDGLGFKQGCVYYIYTAADIDSAIAGLKAGRITKFDFQQTDITKNILLPKTWAGTSKFLIIEGNAANLKGWIKQEMPASQTEAEDLMTQYKIIIQNLSFEAPNDTCIALYGSLNNDINNNRFRRAKSAVHLGFCMNAVIFHNDAVNMTGTAFVANRLYVTGSGTSNAQSNNATFSHNRVFNADSCFASFASYSSNNIDYYKNTIEGNKPQYGIYNDDQGSTTVKMYSHYGMHCETVAYNSMFYTKLNDGVVSFDNTWNQKISTSLVKLVSGAGCILSWNTAPNMMAGDRFSIPNNVKVSMFNNKKTDMTLFTVQPLQYDIHYFFQNGSRWSNSNGLLNDKKITTAP